MSNQSYVEAPFHDDRDAEDDFRCILFTATEASQAHAIPSRFHDKYVVIQTEGSVAVHFGFSLESDAEIDANATPTAAGTITGVGGVAPADRVEVHRHIPKTRNGGTIYFVRETVTSTGTTAVRISMADRPGD